MTGSQESAVRSQQRFGGTDLLTPNFRPPDLFPVILSEVARFASESSHEVEEPLRLVEP